MLCRSCLRVKAGDRDGAEIAVAKFLKTRGKELDRRAGCSLAGLYTLDLLCEHRNAPQQAEDWLHEQSGWLDGTTIRVSPQQRQEPLVREIFCLTGGCFREQCLKQVETLEGTMICLCQVPSRYFLRFHCLFVQCPLLCADLTACPAPFLLHLCKECHGTYPTFSGRGTPCLNMTGLEASMLCESEARPSVKLQA